MVLGGAMVLAMAGQAFALECTPSQEQEAGRLAAGLIKAKISEVVAVEGKQLMNLNSCEVRAGQFKVAFRFNWTGAEGLYWLEGDATFDDSGAGELKSRRASDTLKAAADSKGSMLLASR